MGWSSSQVVPIIHNRKEKWTGKQIYQVKNQIWYVEIKPKYIAQALNSNQKSFWAIKALSLATLAEIIIWESADEVRRKARFASDNGAAQMKMYACSINGKGKRVLLKYLNR